MTLMNPRSADVAQNIVRQVRARLGEAKWEALPAEYRLDVEQAAADWAALSVAAMTVSPNDPPAWQKLQEARRDVRATLMNYAAAEANEVSAAFWEVVRTVVGGAIALAFAAA